MQEKNVGQDMGMGEDDDEDLIQDLERRNKQLLEFNHTLLEELEEYKAKERQADEYNQS